MYTENDRIRIERICQMIFEVASGNFSHRIERSGQNDQLESVVVLLNMMAEEIRESFHHFVSINPHESYKQVVQMTFILDNEFRIRNFDSSAQQLLGLDPEEIKDTPFEEHLTDDSKPLWNKEIQAIKKSGEKSYYHILRLFFSSKNALAVTSLCSVSSLLLKKENQIFYYVSALQTVIQSSEKEKKIEFALQNIKDYHKNHKKKKKILLHLEADKKRIQQVYDYILNNLDKPLPSLKELAHLHGTNEFKLKVGFRQLYDTSVFRFQKEQRLKRAHSFILNSDLSLSRIADICGFRSFPHFSKIFKTRYGYNPSHLKSRNSG